MWVVFVLLVIVAVLLVALVRERGANARVRDALMAEVRDGGRAREACLDARRDVDDLLELVRARSDRGWPALKSRVDGDLPN